MTLENQKLYAKVLDHNTNSLRRLKGMKGSSLRLSPHNSPLFVELYNLVNELPLEILIPVTVFPLWDFEKPKMYLCLEPLEAETDTLYDKAYIAVKKYILANHCTHIDIPPQELLPKYGTKRYNDGGDVKFDHQKPEKSSTSGFLYQRFLTKPLVPREVWLPGKHIKENNALWMVICRQILKKDTTYPDADPEVTWSRIRNYLDSFGYFDLPGFGIQYPRYLLHAAGRAIKELFPSKEIDEAFLDMCGIFDTFTIQRNWDDFIRPPERGIGLGYYEDLKVIVLLALLSPFKPISLYGDQGLLPEHTFLQAVDTLKQYGFITSLKDIEYR
jgi:hypothetical protein